MKNQKSFISLMKSPRLITSILLVGLICFSAVSCDLFEQRSRAYDGPPKVEFFPTSDVVDEGSGELNVQVQLIGSQRSQDTSVEYTVVDSMTTAQEGTHYSLQTSSPVTIPANSSETTVTIDVTGTGLSSGESRTLQLALIGNDQVETGPNIRFFDLVIQGQD